MVILVCLSCFALVCVNVMVMSSVYEAMLMFGGGAAMSCM
jgi:hypothetical protein